MIPVYNGAAFLREAVDSVLAQTYQPLELIVVDDGSTDSSPEVISSYGSRLKSIRQANAGVAQARNTGIDASRGEFIAFLDQDDWWLPDKTRCQVELFLADPHVGLVHTSVIPCRRNAPACAQSAYRTSRSAELQGDCYQRLLFGNGITNSSVMIRKSLLATTGQFDTSLGGNTVQDYDLWLRFAKSHRLGFIPVELTVHRLHPGQGTWDRRAMLRDELHVLERLLGEQAGPTSGPMKRRVANILENLGVAHFDARECKLARRCFARALGARWSVRTSLLYVASFLPCLVLDKLRGSVKRLRRLTLGRRTGVAHNMDILLKHTMTQKTSPSMASEASS